MSNLIVDWVPDDLEDEDAYYEQAVGLVITSIHDDTESVWLHLSDGSAMEFYATATGFDMDIHPAENMAAKLN